MPRRVETPRDYRIHRSRGSALRRDSGGRLPSQQVRGEVGRLAQTSAIHQSRPTDDVLAVVLIALVFLGQYGVGRLVGCH
jgi:hypothetical protein